MHLVDQIAVVAAVVDLHETEVAYVYVILMWRTRVLFAAGALRVGGVC
jgi:hypothetical protein